jgi:hypothetical protein
LTGLEDLTRRLKAVRAGFAGLPLDKVTAQGEAPQPVAFEA